MSDSSTAALGLVRLTGGGTETPEAAHSALQGGSECCSRSETPAIHRARRGGKWLRDRAAFRRVGGGRRDRGRRERRVNLATSATRSSSFGRRSKARPRGSSRVAKYFESGAVSEIRLEASTDPS